jgi:hypothetical protein
MTWRIWLPRFRLRSLLAATTLLCLCLAVWSSHVNPYRLQAIAIQRIRELNGKVETRPATGPDWNRYLVQKFVADDAFVEAVKVKLFALHVPDHVQSQLGHLPFVEHLILDTSGVDDRMVQSLAPAVQLKELWARNTKLTDRSLRQLSTFPKLQVLKISGTDVGDAGLRHLSESPSLEQLSVRWTRVTAFGIDAFRRERPDCDLLSYVE